MISVTAKWGRYERSPSETHETPTGRPAITWHRGVGNNSGFWRAEVGGETIAEVWVHGDYPVGDPMRYLGEIYGKAEYATTLREFKALVAKAHAEREQA